MDIAVCCLSASVETGETDQHGALLQFGLCGQKEAKNGNRIPVPMRKAAEWRPQMPIDPTRTGTLRDRYASAMRRRWLDFQALIVGAVTGQAAPAETEVGVERARILLEPLLAEIILETVSPRGIPRSSGRGSQWQDGFVRQAYRSGAARARAFVQAIFGGARPLNMEAPLHILRLIELLNDNFGDLQEITAVQGEQLRAVLVQSLSEGVGSDETARRIRENIRTIGRNRSEILARTKIVNAHAEGTLNEYTQQGVTFVQPQVEFITAGDARVCTRCLEIASTDRHGLGPGVFPVSQAHGIITVHPR